MAWIVALIVGIALGMAVVGFRGRRRTFELNPRGKPNRRTPLPYARRPALCDSQEREFLECLESAVDGEARVFAKVRMEELVGVEESASNRQKLAANNRTKSRSVDFVLCEPSATEVLAAIDLDRGEVLTEREESGLAFKKGCFEWIGLPWLRFDVSQAYSVEDLRRWLALAGLVERSAKEGEAAAGRDRRFKAANPLARVGAFFVPRSLARRPSESVEPSAAAGGRLKDALEDEEVPAPSREKSGDPTLN